MHILVTILLVIAAIIVLLLIIALFTKRTYDIEREVIINAPREKVFDYLKHLKNQDHFSKWVMMDPNMKKSYKGTDGTVGFVYAWDGNKRAGKGEQEIISMKEGESINIEVRFEKPFTGIAYTPFITETVAGGQTKVKWGARSQMNYPMNIMLVLMKIEQSLGNDMQASLATLKSILEK